MPSFVTEAVQYRAADVIQGDIRRWLDGSVEIWFSDEDKDLIEVDPYLLALPQCCHRGFLADCKVWTTCGVP